MIKNLISFILFFSLSVGISTDVCADIDPQWNPGEYIVKYKLNTINQLREDPELSTFSVEDIEHALTEIMDANTIEPLPLIEASTIVATNAVELDIKAAIDLIDADLVEYISPNFIRKISAVPNDELYSSLWGMTQTNDIDINAPEAADKASFPFTEEIVVGVIDTGIDYNHPDLKDNMWTNPLELAGSPGVDDDGNGIVDDIYGYNAINNSGNPFDDNRHGTHCAGTIGARGNNNIGVAGVVWKVKLMGLKFLNAQGSGSDSDAIKTINYAVSMRNRNGKLRVLSNSWGGGGYNPALLNAIQSASDAGILFVAAAGNSNVNTDVTANYPSNYNVDNVISVAAISSDGKRASFSNYGKTTVDLAAPGVGILSTVPGNRYESLSGTSMATPHVAGIAVLAFSQSSEISPLEVKNILMESIKPLSALDGLMVKAGIPNAESIASNQANYPPELQSIKKQFINPSTQKLSVPLIAFDRENSPLTFSANLEIPESKTLAAQLDKQYGFSNVVSTGYDYYWKQITTADNKQFYVRYDGLLFQNTPSGYVYVANVGPQYYSDPWLLVNAYNPEADTHVDLQIMNAVPPYLEITARRVFQGAVTISASVSDGEKKDTEQFLVEIQQAGVCQ